MSLTVIRSTFTLALVAWANAQVPPIPIEREGQGFTKPTDGSPFLEMFIVPANTTNPSTEATRKRYRGDVMINVWCSDSKGAGQGEAIAEAIAGLFPVVPKNHPPVSVEQTPSVKRAITDIAGWRVIPISIPYRMEA